MSRILLFVITSLVLASAGCAVGGNSTVINPFDWSEPAPIAKAATPPAPATPAPAAVLVAQAD